jgi:hypothetical protein
LLGKLDQLIDELGFPLVVATRASMAPVVRDLATAMLTPSIERCELSAERPDLHRVAMITGSPERFADLPIEPGIEPAVQRELGASVAVQGCAVPASRDTGDLLEILALL